MSSYRSTLSLCLIAILFFSACASQGENIQNKKRAQASRNVGEAYLGQGNFTAALGELLKAEKLNPKDPILQNDLGLAFMGKEKYDLAIGHFKQAIALKPDYSLAKNNLGGAYIVEKQWDNAIAVLEEVTGDMLYATPHYPLANLGLAYYNKGNYEKAMFYLRKSLSLKPEFYFAQLNLGRTYLATGQLNSARSAFELAAKTNPKDPLLLLEMGKTYRALGDYKNAVTALKGAIESSDDPDLALEASNELKKVYQ